MKHIFSNHAVKKTTHVSYNTQKFGGGVLNVKDTPHKYGKPEDEY